MSPTRPETALILASFGRDASVARALLAEHGIESRICRSLLDLTMELDAGAGFAIVAEEVLRGADLRGLSHWISHQPQWSDFPFVLLTRHGGIERNPTAGRMLQLLGNVTFVERPFHPTTLISLSQAALRARRRQYDARAGLQTLHDLNETLETRVARALEEQQQTEAELRQAQKMEAVGQLIGGVAHDFNNLLMVLLAGVNMLERPSSEEDHARRITAMRQAVERGTTLSRQLLAFSRRRAVELKSLYLDKHLSGMRELLDRSLRGDVEVEMTFAEGLWPIEVDPGELELAILNLCVNARDAMQRGGKISISGAMDVQTAGKLRGEVVKLTVEDTGTGIEPEVLSRVFEPFFTTKDIGKGSGLGLAQVYAFMSQSEGDVSIESVVGRGTKVTLLFPRASTTPAPAQESPAKHSASVDTQPASDADVLLVEDDESVAALTAEMLEAIGHRVTHVSSARDALCALANGHPIDIVFSDVMMPGGMNGVDLAREIGRQWPTMPVVLTTGYIEAAREAIAAGIEVLVKPYQMDALVQTLGACRQAKRSQAEPSVGED